VPWPLGAGAIRGAAPGTRLVVADVYGRDPAGGNARALASALGWMAQRQVPVVAVSLVGPENALVRRAVAQAQARGVHVVAAVGNDGAAAPPAYPASYPGVVAVTGVDARNRALIEAGRALHLDYAAPGADMVAAAVPGGTRAVRGTSFAVPFVAARMWSAIAAGRRPIPTLDAEALDLPPRGPDRRHGRGLVCGDCRTRIG
jgi:subtilisin family serine protease